MAIYMAVPTKYARCHKVAKFPAFRRSGVWLLSSCDRVNMQMFHEPVLPGTEIRKKDGALSRQLKSLFPAT
ncbi:MAG: hypothetical protein LBT06_16355 [Hungatella sp.]|nr:hypothetical protein [Hungatella sp.]